MPRPNTEEDDPVLLRSQLAATWSQLITYASDFRRALEQERKQAQKTREVLRMLRAYAGDLNVALKAERAKAKELSGAYGETIMRLVLATQLRHQETGVHLWRVSRYSRLLAKRLGKSEEEAQRICEAAPLHDVGKIGLPGSILNKPGPLNANEWAMVKQHTVLGAQLLQKSPSRTLRLAEIIALTHHERWDGTGYPQGLIGDDIPLAGHIVMLSDQYDALRSKRPYKSGLNHSQVCRVILEGDGRTLPQHFSPRLLSAFRENHREFATIWEESWIQTGEGSIPLDQDVLMVWKESETKGHRCRHRCHREGDGCPTTSPDMGISKPTTAGGSGETSP